jgi:GR25 family glycosyltransferase involved in LPS biosynthesis
VNIGYSILSVDESRVSLKNEIHSQLQKYPFVEVDCVDGRVEGTIEEWLSNNPEIEIKDTSAFHLGELGVWFSQINSWKVAADSELDAIMVLEDDAVILPEFHEFFPLFVDNLPADFDFAAVAVPPDQGIDYLYDRIFDAHGGWSLISEMRLQKETSPHYIGNDYTATAYQGYSCVATLYSKAGAARLLDLVKRLGIYTPVDCFLFMEHFKGNLSGFAPLPTIPQMITFTELGTIARSTGMY